MRLYLVQFDHVNDYVEARTVKDAVDKWQMHVAREWGTDYDGDEEPESIALVHEAAVIR